MLLIDAVEERANVTMLAERAPANLQRPVVAVHFLSPPFRESRVTPVSRRS
jgi:hypothetical protein